MRSSLLLRGYSVLLLVLGVDSLVEFVVEDGRVDIGSMDERISLQQLQIALNDFRRRTDLRISSCAGCGGCCREKIPVLGPDMPLLQAGLGLSRQETLNLLEIPPGPDLEQREKEIKDFSRLMGVSREQAAFMYDFNVMEFAYFRRTPEGSCPFLGEDGNCCIYDNRPYTCRLYVCLMGQRLAMLQESVIKAGTWQLYYLLGKADRDFVAGNPFVEKGSYDQVYVQDLTVDFDPETVARFFSC